MPIPSYLLALAGEYRVCSELNKRGIFATVTYGNRKDVDVYAIGELNGKALKIEVKTSQKGQFVTRITQKKKLNGGAGTPDFWVLFHLQQVGGGTYSERFFILSHAEICEAQALRNKVYGDGYQARHGRQYDFSTGVDNVRVVDVKKYEDAWSKITNQLS